MPISLSARVRTRLFAGLAACSALTSLSSLPVAAETLTLGDALSRVARGDPAVAVGEAKLRAAQSSVRQAGARPNDVVGVDVEDFAGTGPYSPVDRAQTTAWYERTWERGGKRAARIGSALSDVEVADQRRRLRMLDVLEKVQTAWVEALAADAAVPIAEDRLAAATRLEREVARRVQRAVDPLFARERARTAVVQAQIARDQAVDAARTARAGLSAWWGGGADFQVDAASFATTANQPSAGTAIADLALLEAERAAAQARIRLAEANSATDPTLRAGVRHFAQDKAVALVVGGSIPLGGRQAHRGHVERAQAERLAAEAELVAAQAEQRREIDRLAAQRRAALTEIERIGQTVLPGAERAVTLVRDGFHRGGTAFTFFEVGQAQQAVFDARARRIELLRRYHLDGVRLDRLTGRHASLLTPAENR